MLKVKMVSPFGNVYWRDHIGSGMALFLMSKGWIITCEEKKEG